MEHVIPERLRLVQVFHAVARYSRQCEQWSHMPDLSSPTLTTQISQWVKKTGNLIVSVGQPTFTTGGGRLSRDAGDVTVMEHWMSLAVVYDSPVEDVYDPERKPASEAWFPPVVAKEGPG